MRFRVVGCAYDEVSESVTATSTVQAAFLECRGAESSCSRRALGAAVWCQPLVTAELEVRYLAAGDLHDWWKSEAGEVGGQERDDLPDASVPDGEDVEAAGYELLSVVVPQVGAERELAVCRRRQEPPA